MNDDAHEPKTVPGALPIPMHSTPKDVISGGKRLAVRSEHFHALGSERREIHRVLNETKRQQTAALANRIIALGISIHIEDLAYR